MNEVANNFGKAKTIDLSCKIQTSLEKAAQVVAQSLNIEKVLIPVFIVVGHGHTDAFSIPHAKKFAVFFDIKTLLVQNRSEVPDSFIVHEIIHGVHFTLQPEFSPKTYKSAEDHLIRYMLAEGLATYASALLTNSNERSVLWVDILDEVSFKKYIQNAETFKFSFASRIKKYLTNPDLEKTLLSDLFYVHSMDELEKKRIGYFYGLQILQGWESYKPLFNLKLDYLSAKEEFKRYFNLY